MTTHILSMTYQPKIAGVMDGTIRQTIRRTDRFKVGDKLIIHTWTGKPYRSPWGQRMEGTIYRVWDIDATAFGILGIRIPPQRQEWNDEGTDYLAEADGIDPPTGLALKEVLEKYHGKFTDEPVRFQVIRW